MMGNPLTKGSRWCKMFEEKKEGGTSSPPLALLRATGRYGAEALLLGPHVMC